MENIQEETQNIQEEENWINEAIKEVEEHKPPEFETLPALKIEENTIVDFEVDFSKKFDSWTDPVKQVTKAIIPVTHKGERKNFWLNKRNPLYKDIIHYGRDGKTKFKVTRTGKESATRYNIIKEEV